MNRLIILCLTVLTCLYSYSQENLKTVQIEGHIIDLDTIDLERGCEIEKGTSIRNSRFGESTISYKIRIFSCLNRSSYVVVYDTTINQEGGCDNRIDLFNKRGNLLFSKHFRNFNFLRCYISSNGEIIVLEFLRESTLEVEIYDSKGTILATYENHSEKLYTGEEHNFFFIMKGEKENNKYDLIDNFGNISEVQFPNGFIRHIEFSKGEYFYRITIDQDQILYNMNHELIWKIPLNFGLINFLTEEYTISMLKSSEILEIRTILEQEVICSNNSINYKGESINADYYGIMDDFFYMVGRVEGKWIFAFYNFDCEQVYYDFVNIKMSPSVYSVIYKENKFKIIEKNREY